MIEFRYMLAISQCAESESYDREMGPGMEISKNEAEAIAEMRRDRAMNLRTFQLLAVASLL